MSAKRSANVAWRVVGPGPHACASPNCKHPGVPVVRGGTRSDSGVVHHVDEDPSNNSRENLETKHKGCHDRDHGTGRTADSETRARISEKLIGNPGPMLGKSHTIAVREQISASLRAPWTRASLLADLEAAGYTGPTSRPAYQLARILEEISHEVSDH